MSSLVYEPVENAAQYWIGIVGVIIGKDRGAVLVQSVVDVRIITVVCDDLANGIAILFDVELQTYCSSFRTGDNLLGYER